MNRYRNLYPTGPDPYENDAPLFLAHRGVDVFELPDGQFDFVLAGACIAQRGTDADDQAGREAEIRGTIDALLDGRDTVNARIAAHINQHGGKAISFQ